jgi:hypothetical protein
MRALCTLLLIGLTATPAWAQGTGATLQGTVRDAQGGILPGASVTIKNAETGVSRTISVDVNGFYRAAALPPGPYEMLVELTGFVRYARARG